MKKKYLKDIVYDSIMEDIYAGVHKPGDILNEGTLVAKIPVQQISGAGSPDRPV